MNMPQLLIDHWPIKHHCDFPICLVYRPGNGSYDNGREQDDPW
jgi:hypothetical protein